MQGKGSGKPNCHGAQADFCSHKQDQRAQLEARASDSRLAAAQVNSVAAYCDVLIGTCHIMLFDSLHISWKLEHALIAKKKKSASVIEEGRSVRPRT